MIGIDVAKRKWCCRICNEHGKKGDIRIWSNSYSGTGAGAIEGDRYYHPSCMVSKFNGEIDQLNIERTWFALVGEKLQSRR